MIKRIIGFLCAICMLLTLIAVTGASMEVPAAAAETAMRNRKIVSVVYDDSGSMKGDRWVYANYATQALIALLDTSDELYMTFMSDEKVSRPTSLKDIEGAVKEMRDWNHASGTPGASLDTAKKKLDSLSVQDQNAQFWLVVMTDGDIGFDDDNMTVQRKLDSFKGNKMSNGTSLNVAYLRMGAADAGVTEDRKGGLYTFSSDSDKTVFSAIFEMANLISGRSTVKDLTQVDSKTIRFTSKLPLHSISVLSQQSNARIVSASTDEQTLDIDRNIGLDAYDPFKKTKTTLFGNAGVLHKKDGGTSKVIPKGTYTIQFSNDVNLNDLLVQYEPAIGLDLKIHRGADEMTDLSLLLKEDKVNISLTPVVAGTDTPIPVEDLPSGIGWSIEYIVDGSAVDTVKGPEMSDVQLRPGQNTIRGTLQLPGYAPLTVEVTFDIADIVYNLGIDVDQPNPLSYLRGDLNAGSTEGGDVVFHITNDGVPLTKEEVEKLDLELTVTATDCDDSNVEGFLHRVGKIPVPCIVKQNDDGSFTLTPKQIIPFTSFLLHAGVYTVDVALATDDTVTARGSFDVTPQLSDWFDLPGLLLLLLIIAYIIHMILKPKFHGEMIIYELYSVGRGGIGIKQSSSFKKLSMMPSILLPFLSCRTHLYGLHLVAMADRVIVATERSVAKRAYSYGVVNGNPAEDLDTIVSKLRKVKQKDGSSRASDLALSETNVNRRIWIKTSEADNIVWCIYRNVHH